MLKRATKDFHRLEDVPNGATLRVRALNTQGDVQGEGFFDGLANDANWTFADFENDQATAELVGPTFAWTRENLRLAAGASVRIEIFVHNDDGLLRGRFWELVAPDGDISVRIGMVMNILGDQGDQEQDDA